MNETNQGMVIPFGLSGSRMRRSAQEYRRRGQPLEALTLVRRAAQQEDTASAWQALAAELRQLGCWETAAVLLGRVLSRPDRASSAWLDMARCQLAMGQKSLAMDCLYHLLQEAPWSPDGDSARAMLAQMEDGQPVKEPRRTARLIQRGLDAWRMGDIETGERRLRRAVRIAADKTRLLTTMALLHMMQWDFPGAIRCLSRALRIDRDEPQVLCTLAAVFQQMGRRRMARAFLRKAMPLCADVKYEEQFLTTAWATDAWPLLEEYLQERMRQHPWRPALLAARASMLWEKEQRSQAQDLWRCMLSVDPGDRTAAAMLAWTAVVPEGVLPPPGKLPLEVQQKQQSLLMNICLPEHGSEARQALEWMISSRNPQEYNAALTAVQRQPDRKAEITFLKELLARPDICEPVRQQALIRLAELKCFEELTVLIGDRYTTAQCQPVKEGKKRQPWRMFLPMLLKETSRYGQGAQIAGFAAKIWRVMSPSQRLDAATFGSFLWCKTVETLWLRSRGMEAQAAILVSQMPVSARKISRLLRQLAPAIQTI